MMHRSPIPGEVGISFEKLDDVTGLDRLPWIFNQIKKNPENYPLETATFIFFNVMNFKAINQRFGFDGGNEYLRYFANELRRVFDGAILARAGADHLTVIAFDYTNEIVIDKFENLSNAMLLYDKELRSHIKAGIYVSNGSDETPYQMMDHAQLACNEVRSIYNQDIAFFDEKIQQKHELRQYVLEHFEEAFEKHYFTVFYQPVVRALTGKICGYEALARWKDPERGLISPFIFIDVLEKVHLIHKLDSQIIEQVCADLRDDIDSGYAVEPISLNLSRLDFELCNIKQVVDTNVAKYNVPKDYLVLEVTESALASDSATLGNVIREFRQDGYQVWIDDFGSGYSSFNNLQVYDFDVLKIDMNFMRTFDQNPKSRIIISTIVDMAKKLHIHTLTEGVETKEQYEFLKRIGCELIQGYYFGKPTPIEEFQTRRAELCSFEKNETPEESQYFDEIGRINFLDSTPLHQNNMGLDITNDIPIAIIERENREYKALFSNKAFNKVLQSFGGTSVKHTIQLLWDQLSPDAVKHNYELLLQAEKDKKPIEYNLILNENKINCVVRFIARMGKKSAYAFVAKNLSFNENSD